MVDITKAMQGSEQAVADAREKAATVHALNMKMANIQQRRVAAEEAQDLRTLVTVLLPEAEETGRSLVYADAEYKKAVQVAGIVRTVAELKAKAGQLRGEGNTTEAAKWDIAAEQFSRTLKLLSTKKMTVKLPPRTKVAKDIEKLAAESGGMSQLAGLDDLAFFSAIGKALKKVVTAPVNAVKSVGKAVASAATSVAKFTANNGPLVLGTVGAVVGSVVPGIGTTAGAAVGTAVGGLLKASTSKVAKEVPQPPAPDPAAMATQQAMLSYPQQNYVPQSPVPLPSVPYATTQPPPYPTYPNAVAQAGVPNNTALMAQAPLFQGMPPTATPTIPGSNYSIPNSAYPPPKSNTNTMLLYGGMGVVGLLGVVLVARKRG